MYVYVCDYRSDIEVEEEKMKLLMFVFLVEEMERREVLISSSFPRWGP